MITFDIHRKLERKKYIRTLDDIANELLTEVLASMNTSRFYRQMFRDFLHSLRQLDDETGTVTDLESDFFSMIQMKLVGKVCKKSDTLIGESFIVLKLIDSREQDRKKILWVTLQLDETVNTRENQGIIKIIGSKQTCKIISSELGCITLAISTPLASFSEYSIKFRLKKLFVRGNIIKKFQCEDDVVTINNDCVADENTLIISCERECFYMTYHDELIGENFDMICESFRQPLLENNYEQTLKLMVEIKKDEFNKPVVKSFFMCYHAITLSHCGQDNAAKLILYQALEMVQNGDQNNELLVQGRIRRILAGIYNSEGNESEALKNIQKCKEALVAARPSCEKACVLIQEARILRKKGDTETVAELFKSAHECIVQCTDQKRKALTLPMASVERASVLLELKQVNEAKKCLCDFDNCTRIKKNNNIYQLKYLVAQSDFYRLTRDYKKAFDYIQESDDLVESGSIILTDIDKEELGIQKKKTIISKKLD